MTFFAVSIFLIANGRYLFVPWVILFAEMACRYVFSIGHRDGVYLETVLYCIVTHTAIYEFIRFNNLFQMVLMSNLIDIAMVMVLNIFSVMLTNSEVLWIINAKLGRKVEWFELWICRLDGSCMNVFEYVIPIFSSITAFALLLGSNTKSKGALLYFGSIGVTFLYHYCQELPTEIALSLMERYEDTKILKRVNFMRAFKNQKHKLIYSVFANGISGLVSIQFLRLQTK